MRRFREATLGSTVIMGRKTYESIGKPLPWRQNVVVTSQPSRIVGEVETAKTIVDAIKLADDNDCYVIGGAMIYAAAMVHANRILLTEMHGRFEGDVFFKIPFLHQWEEVQRERWKGVDGDCDCDFVEYRLPTS